jgi:hypothetical protein
MAVAADIQQQVYDLLSRTSNVAIVTADQAESSGSTLAPGQRVSAEVISLLPQNRVQVRVGTERYNLDLPIPARVGQNVEMTFLANDPRATFAIARQAGLAPPVSLSDASRLLSLLISSEQMMDPQFRSSMQNIGEMLRRSSHDTGVLANLMDEALTYGVLREGVKAAPQTPGDSMQEPGDQHGQEYQQGSTPRLTADQLRLAAFENNAAQVLRTIAQSSRFTLVEAANQPLTALPFMPGEELDAAVMGTLPGGRTFVQIAGVALELVLPRAVQTGDILRLTYIAAQPKLTFAFARMMPDNAASTLSEAGRWLSVLEHSEGGISDQQMYVLDRLGTVLKNLPPDSPAYTAILDEAVTYQTVKRGQTLQEQVAAAQAGLLAAQEQVNAGNGLVLNDDMAKLLQAIIRGNRLTLLETLSQQGATAGLVPGQQLKGEVLAALGGGRFMVQVAGQQLEFMLPKGVARGDLLNLFYICSEPRQTFLMTRSGAAGDARVSDTGRWLSGFLGETAAQVPMRATLGLLQTLLSGATTDATLLGKMLQQGLQESGLFYESHLARWFGGDYPLDELLKEPQGRLSPRLQQGEAHASVPAENALSPGLRGLTSEHMAAALGKASELAHEGIADQRILPVVSEQLSVLQNGQCTLRGDLFPGQELAWHVSERDAGRNQSGARERTWETTVAITLPRLGGVTARLILDGSRVSVKIGAEESAAVATLEAGRQQLVDQLEGAGLTPTEMSVSHANS